MLGCKLRKSCQLVRTDTDSTVRTACGECTSPDAEAPCTWGVQMNEYPRRDRSLPESDLSHLGLSAHLGWYAVGAQVIVEYADVSGAMAGRTAMHGRRFAGRTVSATFLPEAAFSAGQF